MRSSSSPSLAKRMLSILGSGVLGAALSAAVALAGPGEEAYSGRPRIESVSPKVHADLPAWWSKLRDGHIEAVTQILALYPDHEIYFLARDSELLYDVARFLLGPDSPEAKRIHLLNVSRTNMRAAHVGEYLAQEGISATALAAGKKVLFVDTGFSGTIPKTIAERFEGKYAAQLRTHLLSSANRLHPSTRAFLNSLNPEAAKIDPGEFHTSIITYEHMPRFTNRSTEFALVAGRWEAMSPVVTEDSDGVVSRDAALAFMEDLRAYLERSSTRKFARERLAAYRAWRSRLENGDVAGLAKAMKAWAEGKGLLGEAILRDFVETMRLHGETHLAHPIGLFDLGLAEIKTRTGYVPSNKLELMGKYPEWQAILEDPEKQIPHALENGDFGKLGAIIGAIHDKEYEELFVKALGSAPHSAGKTALVDALLHTEDLKRLEQVLRHAVTVDIAVEIEDTLFEVMKRLMGEGKKVTAGMSGVGGDFVRRFIRPPGGERLEGLWMRLLETGDFDASLYQAFRDGSAPNAFRMPRVRDYLLHRGKDLEMRVYVEGAAKLGLFEEIRKAIPTLVARGTNGARESLIEHYFSKPEGAADRIGFQRLLERQAYPNWKGELERPSNYHWDKLWSSPVGSDPYFAAAREANAIADDAERAKAILALRKRFICRDLLKAERAGLSAA